MKEKVLNFIRENTTQLHPFIHYDLIYDKYGDKINEPLAELCEEEIIKARQSITQKPTYELLEL